MIRSLLQPWDDDSIPSPQRMMFHQMAAKNPGLLGLSGVTGQGGPGFIAPMPPTGAITAPADPVPPPTPPPAQASPSDAFRNALMAGGEAAARAPAYDGVGSSIVSALADGIRGGAQQFVATRDAERDVARKQQALDGFMASLDSPQLLQALGADGVAAVKVMARQDPKAAVAFVAKHQLQPLLAVDPTKDYVDGSGRTVRTGKPAAYVPKTEQELADWDRMHPKAPVQPRAMNETEFVMELSKVPPEQRKAMLAAWKDVHPRPAGGGGGTGKDTLEWTEVGGVLINTVTGQVRPLKTPDGKPLHKPKTAAELKAETDRATFDRLFPADGAAVGGATAPAGIDQAKYDSDPAYKAWVDGQRGKQ